MENDITSRWMGTVLPGRPAPAQGNSKATAKLAVAANEHMNETRRAFYSRPRAISYLLCSRENEIQKCCNYAKRASFVRICIRHQLRLVEDAERRRAHSPQSGNRRHQSRVRHPLSSKHHAPHDAFLGPRTKVCEASFSNSHHTLHHACFGPRKLLVNAATCITTSTTAAPETDMVNSQKTSFVALNTLPIIAITMLPTLPLSRTVSALQCGVPLRGVGHCVGVSERSAVGCPAVSAVHWREIGY